MNWLRWLEVRIARARRGFAAAVVSAVRFLRAVLFDEDTYVFGGWLFMSVGAGVSVGEVVTPLLGLGVGLLVAGVLWFGLGIWLLSPNGEQ